MKVFALMIIDGGKLNAVIFENMNRSSVGLLHRLLSSTTFDDVDNLSDVVRFKGDAKAFFESLDGVIVHAVVLHVLDSHISTLPYRG